MKKLFALFIILGTSLALHGAGCSGCAERRAEMMAKRPTLKAALPKHVAEISDLETVEISYKNEGFEKFLAEQHKVYLKAIAEPRYQKLVSHRPSHRFSFHRYYFGIPSLFFFPGIPEEILEVMNHRSEKLNNMLDEHPNTYIAPLINGLSQCKLTEDQLGALAMLHTIQTLPRKDASDLDKALIKIENKFFLLQQLLNHNTFRNQTINMQQAGQHVMVLEMEMIRQMHATCVQAGDDERAEQFTLIQTMILPLTQYLKWEKTLQMIAVECYKVPGELDKQLVAIQKAYTAEKSQKARTNRELANYR